jgi:ring-1,2-phenylacetyl-CoA epoxidase subunit PaaE
MAPVFHPLRIARVRRETEDAVSVSFDVPAELAPAYGYVPGQFLTLRATIAGQDIRRTYSICSAPGEPLRVGIKRVPGGVFSTWATESLRAGDTIAVMTPDGRFGLGATPAPPRVIAAFAAGSGITPILSIVKAVLATEPESRVFLFYGNRATASILFRAEIEDLKDRHLSRLSVFHVLSREQQDVPALNGHLDVAKLALLLRTVLPAAAIDQALVCGPQPMIETLPAALRALGVPAERVHVERFTPGAGVTARSALAASVAAGVAVEAAGAATVTVIHEGARVIIQVAPHEAIIDGAIRAGRDLPYSCKGGMCCTCRARVVEGRVAMAVNYSLEPWELAAGFVLTCQARPLTDTVTVDFDAV